MEWQRDCGVDTVSGTQGTLQFQQAGIRGRVLNTRGSGNLPLLIVVKLF